MNQQSRKATLAAKWIAQAPEMLEDVELRDGRTFPRALEVWVPKKKVHAPSMRCGPCYAPPETLKEQLKKGGRLGAKLVHVARACGRAGLCFPAGWREARTQDTGVLGKEHSAAASALSVCSCMLRALHQRVALYC